MYRIIS